MHAAPHDPPAVAAPSRKLLPADPPGPLLPPKSEHLQRHNPQHHNHYPHDEQARYELQQQQQQQSAPPAQTSTVQPACLLWARDLQTLLNDDEGCELFEQYLQQEKCDESDLMFVYACNGLRYEICTWTQFDLICTYMYIYRSVTGYLLVAYANISLC